MLRTVLMLKGVECRPHPRALRLPSCAFVLALAPLLLCASARAKEGGAPAQDQPQPIGGGLAPHWIAVLWSRAGL